ncbi:MAG: hypothetical protein JWM87_2688 [Candidatus Eremiobacteraeota bacterium]|nr:hypothetical protein [Candidatus Eremiobacteraeota bacterium]
MNSLQRPLAGTAVGLSISESEHASLHGFPKWQVNRITLQVVSALFGQGVAVVFGHDWRDDGVMEAVHSFAQQVQPPVPLSPAEADAVQQPLLRNILPWPDSPRLDEADRERLSSTLRISPAGLPDELARYADEALAAGRASKEYRYLRARGLTYLRRQLDDACDARVCIGGRQSGYSGRLPGVVEEALFAVRSGTPLYLAGMLGGAAKDVIDAVEGKTMPPDFCSDENARAMYANPAIGEHDRSTRNDRVMDPSETWADFRRRGRSAIVNSNMLSVEENDELCRTPVVDRVVELVLTGLSRVKASR